MVGYERRQPRAWTVAEAKARLSEILRRAEEEGPQRIGTRKEFVVVPAHVWDANNEPTQSLGQWLIENMPRGGEIDVPSRHEGRERPVPFADWTEEDWEAFDRRHTGEDASE
ncbi:MAG: type II toxin-antitoxin system prevent-host-death family antitoxin [Acidobacteria bacterium]|nr:type II toxin-antitoxin system prevent-host-death family antitoxin [Acidobacteriota bacterium]